jgi:4-amino-4-deoxy-L-arabinose transferase-like glycosyltransferase
LASKSNDAAAAMMRRGDGVRYGSAPMLLAVACFWLACTAAARGLALPDEGRYVGVAWEMLRSGDWLVPTLDGMPYFQKPPLFYWITAVSLQVFGRHEIAARLAPLLGATLAAGSMQWFTRAWWSDRGAAKVLLTLVTMPMLFVGAQFANMDMLVAGCITATILALAHTCMLDGSAPNRRRFQLAGFAFAGLGVLAKGLIGIVLPLMVLVLWSLSLRRPRQILYLLWVPGWILFVLVAAPWFALMQAKFPQFLHYFFVVQHVERFTQASFNNPQPAWFYPAALAALCLPWTAWLLAPGRSQHERAGSQVRVLMWVWLLSIVLFFSIPHSKLLGYVLPAVPPLAFIVAQRWPSDRRGPRWASKMAIATMVLAPLSCIAVVATAAHLALKSTAPLAAALARRGNDDVVFLQAYYFDLPFYADLHGSIRVLDDWETHRRMHDDDWHRELSEAASFAPVLGQRLLLPLSPLDHLNCPGKTSWIVGEARLAARYPLLANLQPVVENGGVSVWQLRGWVADPGAGCVR